MESLDNQTILSYITPASRSLISDIHVFDTIDSTNSWLLQNKKFGAVCLADKQLQGRGRRGNTWSSPDNGNIYLSLCWGLEKPSKYLSLLSLLTGISICESLKSLGLQGHGLKWPNDIYFDQRKLGGILIESNDSFKTVVLGIGLNLYAVGEKSWSHLGEAMPVPDRNKLIAFILDELTKRLDNFKQLEFVEFKRQWSTWDIVSGKQVVALKENEKVYGIAQDIDEQGHIKIRLESGVIEHFHSTEISLRW